MMQHVEPVSYNGITGRSHEPHKCGENAAILRHVEALQTCDRLSTHGVDLPRPEDQKAKGGQRRSGATDDMCGRENEAAQCKRLGVRV